MRFTAEGAKATVRPVITYMFAAAQIGLGIMWALGGEGSDSAKDSFAGLAVFTMLIVRDYFADRKDAEKVAAEKESPAMVTVPATAVGAVIPDPLADTK